MISDYSFDTAGPSLFAQLAAVAVIPRNRQVLLLKHGLSTAKVRSCVGSFDYPADDEQRVRQYGFVVEAAAMDHIRLAGHETYIWAEPEKDLLARAADQAVLESSLVGALG